MLPLHFLLLSLIFAIHPVNGYTRKKALWRSSKRGPAGSLQLLLQLNMTDNNDISKNTPCCQDTLNAGVCRAMYRRDPDRFNLQCRSNADFSFIQCCIACHFANDIERRTLDGREIESGDEMYDMDVERMLQSPSAQCIDRRTARFCEALITQKLVDKNPKSEIWRRMPLGNKDLSNIVGGIDYLRDAPCETSALAFRVCRKTCGYCAQSRSRAVVKFNPVVAKNPTLCQTLY